MKCDLQAKTEHPQATWKATNLQRTDFFLCEKCADTFKNLQAVIFAPLEKDNAVV